MQIAENLQAVITARNITVRYNQISKRVELIMPGGFSIIDEQDNATLTLLTDEAVKAGMTAARIDEFCTAIAARNPFCPVRAFIESVEWDGHSRFEQFFKQIDTPTPEIARSLIKKWLVQAVAAVYESDGLSAAGVLVLMGSQGVGKTRLLRSLAKGVDDYFLEGALLSPDDKDSVMIVCSRWIVELGEVDATFRKSDIAQLKAFITKSVDVLRKPYARKDSFLPRRSVFAASVNEFQFLQDSTGNRRFWPIEVTGVTLDADLNIQQLWAEMKTLYDLGVTWHMSAVELGELNAHCALFEVSEPIVEKLLSRFEFDQCADWQHMRMKDIVVQLEVYSATKADEVALAKAIRKYNGNQPPKIIKGVREHIVPKVMRGGTSFI